MGGWRIICALLLAVGLCACSGAKLAYNNAPELAFWWLDGYLDFDHAQADEVRSALNETSAWHRREELPKIAALLADAKASMARDPDADEVCQLAGQLRDRARAVADHALPAMVSIAPRFSIDQLETMRKKYAAANQEFRNDWIDLTPAERKKKRFGQIVDRTEMVYGRLDATQRSEITQAVARSSFDPAAELAERMRRQRDVMDTLRSIGTQPGDSPSKRATLAAMVDRAFDSPDAQYHMYRQSLLRESCQAIAATHASMTVAQRDKAAKRLGDYEADARALAAQTR